MTTGNGVTTRGGGVAVDGGGVTTGGEVVGTGTGVGVAGIVGVGAGSGAIVGDGVGAGGGGVGVAVGAGDRLGGRGDAGGVPMLSPQNQVLQSPDHLYNESGRRQEGLRRRSTVSTTECHRRERASRVTIKHSSVSVYKRYRVNVAYPSPPPLHEPHSSGPAYSRIPTTWQPPPPPAPHV